MFKLLGTSPVCFQCCEIMCLCWESGMPSWSSPWFMPLHAFHSYCVCQRWEPLLGTNYMFFLICIFCVCVCVWQNSFPQMSLCDFFILNKICTYSEACTIRVFWQDCDILGEEWEWREQQLEGYGLSIHLGSQNQSQTSMTGPFSTLARNSLAAKSAGHS